LGHYTNAATLVREISRTAKISTACSRACWNTAQHGGLAGSTDSWVKYDESTLAVRALGGARGTS